MNKHTLKRSGPTVVLIPLVLLLLFSTTLMFTMLLGKQSDDTAKGEPSFPTLNDSEDSSVNSSLSVSEKETTDIPPQNTTPISKGSRITSHTGTYLNLYVDYSSIEENDSFTVTVTVGVDCYSLSVGSRDQLGTVTVNGETQTFSSPKIDREENTRANIDFTTLTFTVPKQLDGSATLEISASWVFNGTYHGKSLGTITLSDTVTLPS